MGGRTAGRWWLTGLLMLLPAAGQTQETAPAFWGYGGPNGTRVYADCRPPLNWDGRTRKNILWEVPLPSWGHGSPLAVAGKVFVICEPVEGERDLPLLMCLDQSTGKVLWQKELDHTPVLPSDGPAARSAWKEVMAEYALRFRLGNAYLAAKDDASKQAALAEMEKVGLTWNARWSKVVHKGTGMYDQPHGMKVAAKAGFSTETWRHGCSNGSTDCIGFGYATPVSDGKDLYVCTAWGGFFCFDLEGKQKWVTYAPGHAGEYCCNARSPILYKNLLLSDIGNYVRAFDRTSGKLLWSSDGPWPRGRKNGSHTIVSPMVMTVGGKDILWAAGCTPYLLPEGKLLRVEGWKDEGMQTLVKYDEPDVIFFCGSGEHCGWTGKGVGEINPPAAVRFRLENDTLKATVLWHGGTVAKELGVEPRSIMGGNAPWMLYHRGKFYHTGGIILDVLTGKKLAGTLRRGGASPAVPATGHLLCLAGNHVFGLSGETMEVFTVDGQRVASNALAKPAAGRFSHGCTFTFAGERVFIRGLNHLVCVGAR